MLAIRIDPAFQRLQIRQKISVRQHHPTRLGGRAGGKQNLRDVPPRQRLVGQRLVDRPRQFGVNRPLLNLRWRLGMTEPLGDWPRRFAGDAPSDDHARAPLHVGQILQFQYGDGSIEQRFVPRRDDQPGRRFTCNTPGKLNGSAIIHRHGHSPAQQTPPKRSHPLRPVRSPKQHAVSRPHAASFQFLRARESHMRQLRVAPGLTPVAPPLHHGNVARVARKLRKQRNKVSSGHSRCEWSRLEQSGFYALWSAAARSP